MRVGRENMMGENSRKRVSLPGYNEENFEICVPKD